MYQIMNRIILGNYNAISNRVSIMPGTKTADNTVIASNSLCNIKLFFGTWLIKNNFKRDWIKFQKSSNKILNKIIFGWNLASNVITRLYLRMTKPMN